MTRSPQPDADDLHARFDTWLRAGGDGSLPRDVALHAAHCPVCRHATAAMDLLLMVDPGRAALPPSRAAVVHAPAAAPRAILAAGATLVLAAAGAWVGISAVGPWISGRMSESPDQQVLGGFGAGATATPGAESRWTPSVTPTDAPSNEPASPSSEFPSPGGPLPTAAPPVPIPTAQPSVPPPATATEAPTQRPTRSASPTASPTPTPLPTPQPTPEPTPPPLDDCEDGIDNDGDTFIDLDDPGCQLDGDESSA